MKELLEVSTNGVSSSAPSGPNTGDFWTDTSSDPPILKSWNGSSWIEVGSAGGSGGGYCSSYQFAFTLRCWWWFTLYI